MDFGRKLKDIEHGRALEKVGIAPSTVLYKRYVRECKGELKNDGEGFWGKLFWGKSFGFWR
jgi:hypothetical protein